MPEFTDREFLIEYYKEHPERLIEGPGIPEHVLLLSDTKPTKTPKIDSKIGTKTEKKTEDISVPKLALSIGMDLGFMALGSLIGNVGGGAATTALVGTRLAQNSIRLAQILTKVGRVTGETAGLATSSYIQGSKPEEAIKGAISAQAIGYGAMKALKYGAKGVKAITPAPVKEKIVEKKDKVYNWLFHGGNARPEDIKDVHKEVLDTINLSTTVRRNAEYEVKKLTNSPNDWLGLLNIVEREVAKNPELIPDLPQDKALEVIKRIKTFPINEYSAEIHFIWEIAKMPQIEKEARHILEKYPTLSKYDNLYKHSTDAYYKTIADKIDPALFQQLGLETAEIQKRINNKLETFERIASGIIRNEPITADILKTEIKETKALIKTLDDMRSQRLLDNPKDVGKIISNLNSTVKQLSKVSMSEIREVSKISDILTKSIADIERVSKEFPVEVNITPAINKIREAMSRVSVIDNAEQRKAIQILLKEASKDIRNIEKQYPQVELKKTIQRLSSSKTKEELTKEAFRQQLNSHKALINQLKIFKKQIPQEYRKAFNGFIEALDKTATDLSKKVYLSVDELAKAKNQIETAISSIENILSKTPALDTSKVKNLLEGIKRVSNTLSNKEARDTVVLQLERSLQDLKKIVSQDLQKQLKGLRHTIESIGNSISKLGVVRSGLLKQQLKELTLTKTNEIRNLLPNIIPKDRKVAVDYVHNMYYPRIGLPAKLGMKDYDVVTGEYEYQMERVATEVLNAYKEYVENVAKYLKERKYPTLLGKYADDILSNKRIEYKTNRDFADIVTNAYSIPVMIDRVRNVLNKWKLENKYIATPLQGIRDVTTGREMTVLVPYVSSSKDDLIKSLASLNGLEEEKAGQLLSSLMSRKLVGEIPELGVVVHRDIYELIGNTIKPLFAGKMMMFDSTKNITQGLSSANTIIKRINMLFGIIHYKALTTAAIGTGRVKELGKAMHSIFRSDEWFRENILPMQREIYELTQKYNIKSTFFLANFDDVREQIQRMMLRERINPIIKIMDKLGFIKLAGEFDKRLWDRMFYTLKCASARNVLGELEKGRITKETAESFLDKLGSAFGGNYEWLFMRQSAREFTRFLLFAPDWYLTMIRHLTSSVKGHELFGDFFRRIFLLHYALANEISWQTTGQTTYERYLESKDWNDLFRVPIVSIDPITGKYKRSYINLLGFEIEGIELLGIGALHDFIYELLTTNKSVKEAALDASEKWAKHVANKKGPLFSSLFTFYKSLGQGDVTELLKVFPAPIFASSFNYVINRNVTFTEAGEKVPAELIAVLYQTGIKFQSNKALVDAYRDKLRKKVSPQEARIILNEIQSEIKAVTDRVRAVKVPVRLQSDNPKTWFDNAMRSAIIEDIKRNYKSDIEKIVKGEMSREMLRRKVLMDFQGTTISYHPKFRKYVEDALRNMLNKDYQKYRREHAE